MCWPEESFCRHALPGPVGMEAGPGTILPPVPLPPLGSKMQVEMPYHLYLIDKAPMPPSWGRGPTAHPYKAILRLGNIPTALKSVFVSHS